MNARLLKTSLMKFDLVILSDTVQVRRDGNDFTFIHKELISGYLPV